MNSYQKLFWKISATLLCMLALIGMAYVMVTGYTAHKYFQEVNQSLYAGLADHLVKEVKPLIKNGKDTIATHHIMHSMMVINPSVEVYLLNSAGEIVDYVVPYHTVKLEKVDLVPVKKFIATKGKQYIEGDDPKGLGQTNVFSAAPIYEDNVLTGYAYIILAGQAQQLAWSSMIGSYFLRSDTLIFLATLIGSLVIGLVALWILTRNLGSIIEVFRRFKEGDRSARILHPGKNDLALLAVTFNEMADTLVSNIEQLQSVENLRRELIANVSHDLRTPISIMQGYAETMAIKENTLSSEDRRHYIKIIQDSADKLSKLIAQLFEYSKLEANQIKPEKEAFPIADLTQDIALKYDLLAKAKKINLKLDIPERLPHVYADIALVERVLQNLVDNAIKFTPDGGTITLALRDLGSSVEMRITDTGPGIPAQEHAAIFERYKSGTAGNNETPQGTGLGLAIVKKILELHDATIRVQSKINEGTAFMFQLQALA